LPAIKKDKLPRQNETKVWIAVEDG